MNKSELVEEVAHKLSLPKGEAARLVDAVLGSITAGLRNEDKVTLSGFGTFLRKRRAARTGVNPATKAVMEIKAAATCSFRPSTVLREELERHSSANASR